MLSEDEWAFSGQICFIHTNGTPLRFLYPVFFKVGPLNSDFESSNAVSSWQIKQS